MKKILAILVLTVVMFGCGGGKGTSFTVTVPPLVTPASAQEQVGGNSVFSGQYVFESFGHDQTAANPYAESGLFIADGAGHGTLSSQSTSFMGSAAINSTWTYTITNYQGTATSSVGDSAKIFCTVTGKVCIMVEAVGATFPWQARFERE